jgi:drug/metabolite transporter (DMT)-like permease
MSGWSMADSGRMPSHPRSSVAPGVALAAMAAVAFGVTTPLVARVGGGLGPLTVAALLYLGAAAVALLARPLVPRSGRPLARADATRLGLVVLFGAVLAPTLYAAGLGRAGPTATSLALNFEALFTAVVAWSLYREPIGRRVGLAMLLMLCGGALVARGAGGEAGSLAGVALVVAATASWAADNGLSRGLAEADPFDVILAKGALGGLTTGALAVVLGEPLPPPTAVAVLLALGATGYGLSLRFYLLAQRRIGAARTGSVFAAGPFLGAALGWVLGDRGGAATWMASGLFLAGVALHATERHAHPHGHAALSHEHAHDHRDGHHEHRHEPPVSGEHTHRHTHAAVTHHHEHAPDLHHGHGHESSMGEEAAAPGPGGERSRGG